MRIVNPSGASHPEHSKPISAKPSRKLMESVESVRAAVDVQSPFPSFQRKAPYNAKKIAQFVQGHDFAQIEHHAEVKGKKNPKISRIFRKTIG